MPYYDLSWFVSRVLHIIKDTRERIVEDRARLIKGNSMPTTIRCRFSTIPFESQLHKAVAAHQRGRVKNWPKLRKVARGLRCIQLLLVCVTYPLFDIHYLIDFAFEVNEFFGINKLSYMRHMIAGSFAVPTPIVMPYCFESAIHLD